jgi:hypothetical protein
MPDVDDDHALAVDTVVNAVWRSGDPKGVKLAPVGLPSAVWIVLERPYSLNDPTNYSLSSPRASLIEL